MKAICPRCKAEYDVEQQATEIEAECPCGQKFIVAARPNRPSIDKPNLPLPKPPLRPVPPPPTLISCPDCGRKVSRLASACPGCGRSISQPAATDGTIDDDATGYASIYVPQPQITIGTLSFIASGVCFFLMFAVGHPAFGIGIFWGVLLGCICLSVRHVRCLRCGHNGPGKCVSSPNGCAFFLLLLLGVIPAFIYYFIVRTRYRCLNCGQLTD